MSFLPPQLPPNNPPPISQPAQAQPTPIVIKTETPQSLVTTNSTTNNSESNYQLNNNSVAAPRASAEVKALQINNYADFARETYGDISITRPVLNIYANVNSTSFDGPSYTAGVNVAIPLGGGKARKQMGTIAANRALVSSAKICQSVREQAWDKEMTLEIVGKKYLACVKPMANVADLPQNDLSATAVQVNEARLLLQEMRAENDRLTLEIAQLKGKYYKQRTERPAPVRGLW